jgi:hypothetical protein
MKVRVELDRKIRTIDIIKTNPTQGNEGIYVFYNMNVTGYYGVYKKKKKKNHSPLPERLPSPKAAGLALYSRSLKKSKKSVLSQLKKISDLIYNTALAWPSNVGIVHSSEYQ